MKRTIVIITGFCITILLITCKVNSKTSQVEKKSVEVNIDQAQSAVGEIREQVLQEKPAGKML